MKKIFAGILILAVWIFVMSSFGPTLYTASADSGNPIGNKIITMVTATGLFSTGQTYTFTMQSPTDNIMNTMTCDFLSTSGTATGQITLETNLGEAIWSTGSVTTIASKPTNSLYQITSTSKPFRNVRMTYALVGGSSNTVTVYCGAVQ